MNLTEFHAQCLVLLEAAREWSDAEWERLEDSPTMGVLDALMELEDQLER